MVQGLASQVPCEAVVGGDRHSFVIAAASVIAKVAPQHSVSAPRLVLAAGKEAWPLLRHACR